MAIFVAYIALFWFCASSLYGDELSPGRGGRHGHSRDLDGEVADQRGVDVK
jgi:hypothetical protein